MAFSRRGFLRALGTGMAVSAVPAIPTLSNALRFEPARSRRRGSPFSSTATRMRMGLRAQCERLCNGHWRTAAVIQSSNDALVACGWLRCTMYRPEPVGRLRLNGDASGPGGSFVGARKNVDHSITPRSKQSQTMRVSAARRPLQVPLDHQYSHDLDAMLAKVNDSTTLVYICNPNNPTLVLGHTQKSIEIEFVAKWPPEVIVTA